MPTSLIHESADLAKETLVSMAEACNCFPVKISRASVERMIRRGTRGITLETIFICNRRYTSKEAIHRFIDRTQQPLKAKETSIEKRNGMSKRQLEAGYKKFNLPIPE